MGNVCCVHSNLRVDEVEVGGTIVRGETVTAPEVLAEWNNSLTYAAGQSAGEDTTAEASDQSAQAAAVPKVIPVNCKRHNEQLNDRIKEKPYLNKKHHALFQYVTECQQQIGQGNEDEAENALLNLTMELADEERTIAAAFMRFDSSGDGVLSGDEIRFMLDYLGFPCDPKAIQELMAAVDTDLDNTVSFQEFMVYVGNLGGSEKLFEVRRSQIEDRRIAGSTGAAREQTAGSMDKEALRLKLMRVGIDEDAQAFWQLTAHPSELEAAAAMQPCQQAAIHHIRALARENHEAALPKLKERVAALGFTEIDLYMALAWIRELAPIVIHVNMDKLGKFLKKDTHYRNQFETNTSSGLLKTEARVKWERGLFGIAYDKASPFDRPKYGVQNIVNDFRGVMGCIQYGDSYIVLKDVRLRCTLSPEDSANLPAKRLSVPDFYAHVLAEYTDNELKETIRVAAGGDEKLGNSKSVIEKWGKYKEVQIHGEIDLNKHVDRIVVAERHKNQQSLMEGIANSHGWRLTWMKDMKKELEEKAGGREMDDEKWKEKLAKLKKEQDDYEKVHDFVAAVHDSDTKARNAGRKVQWEFSVSSGYQAFDKNCQNPIEEQYQKFKTSGVSSTGTITTRGITIEIDFNTMKQSVPGKSRVRDVIRRELDAKGQLVGK